MKIVQRQSYLLALACVCVCVHGDHVLVPDFASDIHDHGGHRRLQHTAIIVIS